MARIGGMEELEPEQLRALVAKVAAGALLFVALDVYFWMSALEDFASARDGWLVVVSGRMIALAFGFAVLLAWLVLLGVLEWRVGLRENARVALIVVMLLSAGGSLLVQGPVTDAVAAAKGLRRCAPKDELRRGARPSNDEVVRAYLVPATAPADAIDACRR